MYTKRTVERLDNGWLGKVVGGYNNNRGYVKKQETAVCIQPPPATEETVDGQFLNQLAGCYINCEPFCMVLDFERNRNGRSVSVEVTCVAAHLECETQLFTIGGFRRIWDPKRDQNWL